MAIAHHNCAALLKKHDYTEIKQVGEGSFGKAILVASEDGSRLICKMVDVSKASRKEMEDAVKEGKLLAELKHPYIVRYRESFTDNGWLCILMDYCEGGDLTQQIEIARRSRQPIPEDRVLKWFTQAIMALKYCHDKHILHRDLKPSNFFLSKGGSLKMGDFGIAKVLACTIAVAKTQIGTPYYLSPELCQEKPYAWPSDMWSMGCILFEMCALKVPFDAPSIAGLVKKIVKEPVPPCPSSYSSFTVGLCAECLNRVQECRPGSGDILERPQIKDIVDKMMTEAEDCSPSGPAAGPRMQPSSSQVSAASNGSAGGGGNAPYAGYSGHYKKGDLVEYFSSSHKDWLPAVVTNIDEVGRIVIDLKPSTWITQAEQATRCRPRCASPNGGVPAVRAASPSPQLRRTPSAQRVPSAAPSPRGGGFARQPSPRSGGAPAPVSGRPGSRGVSPQPAAPFRRSPSVGAMPGGGAGGGGPPSARCASPMIQRSPSHGGAEKPWCASPMRQRSPSVGGGFGGGVSYRKGDQIEYYSPSHKDWLPAVVTGVDVEGRIIIDLKPNTWLSKEDQQQRVRRRSGAGGGGGVVDRPGSHGTGSAVQRSPSAGGLVGGTPRGRTPSTNARAPSPGGWRAPIRAESPGPGAYQRPGEAGAGTPRVRPPGLPSGHRISESPLRQGGRHIAGF
mmetsp:Transcript_21750/g.74778  ORF Transcript_21750/g.74778 Transcript_21750/m.74778 type:complete len:675 (+) Transcript_21750:50-2074(+)